MLDLYRSISMKLSQILQSVQYELAAARDLNNEAMVHIREAERVLSNLSKYTREEMNKDEEMNITLSADDFGDH